MNAKTLPRTAAAPKAPRRKKEAAAPGRSTSLGEQVSALRRARGWTLKLLSERTGIASSTLSKVENQKISLSYDNIIKLAQGFDIEIADLFSANTANANSRRSINRKGEGRPIVSDNYDYLYLCNDLKKKKMIPLYTVHKCRNIEEFGEFVRHSGEEFIYVLEGTLEVHTDSYAPVRLEPGDSIYIDSMMPHAYISVGPVDAIALGVCTSPERLAQP